MTFTLDDETVAHIRGTAAKLRKPQSQIVREAVADYAAKADRLSERERTHLLGVLDDLAKMPPTRQARAADAEIRAIRAARRTGGRRSA